MVSQRDIFRPLRQHSSAAFFGCLDIALRHGHLKGTPPNSIRDNNKESGGEFFRCGV